VLPLIAFAEAQLGGNLTEGAGWVFFPLAFSEWSTETGFALTFCVLIAGSSQKVDSDYQSSSA
jgi:hypothetical protein